MQPPSKAVKRFYSIHDFCVSRCCQLIIVGRYRDREFGNLIEPLCCGSTSPHFFFFCLGWNFAWAFSSSRKNVGLADAPEIFTEKNWDTSIVFFFQGFWASSQKNKAHTNLPPNTTPSFHPPHACTAKGTVGHWWLADHSLFCE